jgi:hypothetical protein
LANLQTAGSYVMASQLSSYALANHTHSNLQTAGSYVMASQLANLQTAGSYAMASQLSSYALANHTHSNLQTAGSYAMASQLANLQTAGSYAMASHNHDNAYLKLTDKASLATLADATNDNKWVSANYLTNKLASVNTALSNDQLTFVSNTLALNPNFYQTAPDHLLNKADTTGNMVLNSGIVNEINNTVGTFNGILRLNRNVAFFDSLAKNSTLQTEVGKVAANQSALHLGAAVNLVNVPANLTALTTSLVNNVGFRTTVGNVAATNPMLQAGAAANLVNVPANLTALTTSLVNNVEFRTTMGNVAAANSTLQTAVASNLVTVPANLTGLTNSLSSNATLANNVGTNIVSDATKRAQLTSAVTDADLKFRLGDSKKTIWCADGVCRVPDTGTADDIMKPDGNLKLNKFGIMFGGNNVSGREHNSAQISAGVHESNSLNIVGMSSDGNPNNRKVTTWAEGGFKINGRVQITGASSTPTGSGDMSTHFNHSDGNNYIRGTTHVNGQLTVNGRNILAELDDIRNNMVRYGQNIGLVNIGQGGWISEHWGAARTDVGDKNVFSAWNLRRR